MAGMAFQSSRQFQFEQNGQHDGRGELAATDDFVNRQGRKAKILNDYFSSLRQIRLAVIDINHIARGERRGRIEK